MVFPAFIWAALRLGPQGATLAVAVAAVIAVLATSHAQGFFVELSPDDSALDLQLYITFAVLTTYCLAAIVSERRRPAQELAESQRREGELVALERQRIARDLHDSVSQSLFSATLHVRTAQHALTEQASALSARERLVIEVDGPGERLPLRPEVEEQLYRLGQEALANVVKHARASRATVRIAAKDDTVSHRGVRRRPRLRSGRRGPRTLRPAVDARPESPIWGPDRGHKHPRPRYRPTRRGTGPALMAHADRTIRWITPCG